MERLLPASANVHPKLGKRRDGEMWGKAYLFSMIDFLLFCRSLVYVDLIGFK